MKHFWVFCESFCDRKRYGISLHLFPSWQLACNLLSANFMYRLGSYCGVLCGVRLPGQPITLVCCLCGQEPESLRILVGQLACQLLKNNRLFFNDWQASHDRYFSQNIEARSTKLHKWVHMVLIDFQSCSDFLESKNTAHDVSYNVGKAPKNRVSQHCKSHHELCFDFLQPYDSSNGLSICQVFSFFFKQSALNFFYKKGRSG